jgi:Glycerophosphoryl diester phosphodiesterase family
VGIGPSKTDMDAALVEAAHALCLDVHPYTANETAEMEALIALGVDGTYTNFPDRLASKGLSELGAYWPSRRMVVPRKFLWHCAPHLVYLSVQLCRLGE